MDEGDISFFCEGSVEQAVKNDMAFDTSDLINWKTKTENDIFASPSLIQTSQMVRNRYRDIYHISGTVWCSLTVRAVVGACVTAAHVSPAKARHALHHRDEERA